MTHPLLQSTGRDFALSFAVRPGDVPKLTEKLLNARYSAPRVFADALNDEADKILAKAKERAPYRTGRLYRSGRVYRSGEVDPRINIQFLAPYALAVHETHPRKSHFLSRSVDEALPGLGRRLLQALKTAGVFG